MSSTDTPPPEPSALLERVARRLVAEAADAKHWRDAPELLFPSAPPRLSFHTEPGWFGIWAPVGARFSQRGTATELSHWAQLPEIPEKGQRKRVLLLGESVARGFLYDPVYTPARILQAALDQIGIPNGVEVLDLARVSLLDQDLIHLLDHAELLQPDAVVVVAGNNWSGVGAAPGVWTEAYRANGIRGCFQLDESLLRTTAISVMERVAALARRGVRVTFVLPERNLAGFRWNKADDLPWSMASGIGEWVELYRAARAALEAGDLDVAERAAQRMRSVDGGACAVSSSLLGDCGLRRGDGPAARVWFERSWEAHAQSPIVGIRDTTKQVIRGYAGAENIEVVDLPKLFAAELEGAPTGDVHFLDYCHLTSHGIRQMVASIADGLASAWSAGRPHGADDLRSSLPAVDPWIEAQARFAGAIHSAHWGRDATTILEGCRRALASSERIADGMRLMSRVLASGPPIWKTPEALQLLAAYRGQPLGRYLVQSSKSELLVDHALLGAMRTALHERFGDREDAATRGAGPGETIDLLAAESSPDFFDRSFAFRRNKRSPRYYQSFSPESTFWFRLRAATSATLHVTLRLCPPATAADRVSIVVNDEVLAELRPTDRWSTHKVVLPAERSRGGDNKVEIVWPAQVQAAAQAQATLTSEGVREHRDLWARFGDVQDLRVELGA